MLDLVFSPSAAAVVGTSEELWHDAVVRWTLTALVDRCVICRPTRRCCYCRSYRHVVLQLFSR